ncbi:pyridoxamine 5'-phosphate oxidase family protein (plasmid) [Haloferax sp. S1W]|uniref:pyridoxamine 5'-phosphate oxidase family protein n=1 Tax=Haloferax sp. S1W TaxID=3377110 RepID=UPI0037CB272E
MADAEIDDFLGRAGTGVLSFARRNESYSIPISYGFDRKNTQFFVRLGFGPDSEKKRFTEVMSRVSFVVYGQTADGWKSVVARGRLEEITEDAIDSDLIHTLKESEIPLVTIFDQPLDELDFRMYRLVVDDLSGRKEVPVDEHGTDPVS